MENTNNSNMNNNYDEISLRELILTIWNGKVIIAICTAVAVLLAGIYSFAMLDNVYQTKATFGVSPIKVTNSSTDLETPLYADIDNKIALNVSQYAAFFQTDDFLRKLIEELQLKDDNGILLAPENIAGKITTSFDEKTIYIDVNVTDSEPEEAFRIAEALRPVYIEYINEYAKSNINDYKNSIQQNLEVTRTELNTKRADLDSFRIENGDTELMSDDIIRLRSRITSLNDSLTQIEANIAADVASLDNVVEQLRADGVTDVSPAEIISEIKQSVGGSSSEYVGGEIYLQTDLDMNNSQIAHSVRMVELNRLQLRLLNNFNSQQSFTKQLTEVEDLYRQTQENYSELNPRYLAVKSEYDIASSTYNAYVQKLSAAQSIDTLDIANPHISQVMSPELPLIPSGPRRMLNIAIALVLGVMLGVFIVFFREYWKNSAVKK